MGRLFSVVRVVQFQPRGDRDPLERRERERARAGVVQVLDAVRAQDRRGVGDLGDEYPVRGEEPADGGEKRGQVRGGREGGPGEDEPAA